MKEDIQPEQVRRLKPGEMFSFGCGPDVPCFNDCCRELELALTPYDVARLRKNLAISASEFLDRYCLIERKNDTSLPEVFLGMVDDGMASCPFVSSAGCQVYQDRPSACRMYPLGRAAGQTPEGRKREFHVLLSEPHCHGFTETNKQDVKQWTTGQGLIEYNAVNDCLMTILQHPKAKQITSSMAETFLETLFNLDGFRTRILAPNFSSRTMPTAEERLALATDDQVLLGFAIRWLRYELFNE